jgi:hypothetical protein
MFIEEKMTDKISSEDWSIMEEVSFDTAKKNVSKYSKISGMPIGMASAGTNHLSFILREQGSNTTSTIDCYIATQYSSRYAAYMDAAIREKEKVTVGIYTYDGSHHSVQYISVYDHESLIPQ